MINDNIATILDKIRQLDQQLEEELNARQTALSYQLHNRRVKMPAPEDQWAGKKGESCS